MENLLSNAYFVITNISAIMIHSEQYNIYRHTLNIKTNITASKLLWRPVPQKWNRETSLFEEIWPHCQGKFLNPVGEFFLYGVLKYSWKIIIWLKFKTNFIERVSLYSSTAVSTRPCSAGSQNPLSGKSSRILLFYNYILYFQSKILSFWWFLWYP